TVLTRDFALVLSLPGTDVIGRTEPPEALLLPLRERITVDLLGTDIATAAEAAARLPPGKGAAGRHPSGVEAASPRAAARTALAERPSRRRAAAVESPTGAAPRTSTPSAPTTPRGSAADRGRDQDRAGPEGHTTGRARHCCFSPPGRPRPGARMGICSAPVAGVKVNNASGASGLRFQPLKSAANCGMPSARR